MWKPVLHALQWWNLLKQAKSDNIICDHIKQLLLETKATTLKKS
jgi:hypothetical protein